jgi:hypothetical protein
LVSAWGSKCGGSHTRKIRDSTMNGEVGVAFVEASGVVVLWEVGAGVGVERNEARSAHPASKRRVNRYAIRKILEIILHSAA